MRVMRDTGNYDHGLWLECNAADAQEDLNRHYRYCPDCESGEDCEEAQAMLKEVGYWDDLAYAWHVDGKY